MKIPDSKIKDIVKNIDNKNDRNLVYRLLLKQKSKIINELDILLSKKEEPIKTKIDTYMNEINKLENNLKTIKDDSIIQILEKYIYAYRNVLTR